MNLINAIKKNIFSVISCSALALNQDTYVIGGYVRDVILSKDLVTNDKEIYIVTIGSGICLAKHVLQNIKHYTNVVILPRFDSAMIKHRYQYIHFLGARKRLDYLNSIDFTINSLSISLNYKDYGRLIDPFNGINDIHNKIISTPLDPLGTYDNYPIIMLRAIRFASQLNFTLEEKSFQAICHKYDRIRSVSIERIIYEFNKIMLSKKPFLGLKLLDETGLLSIILPELIALKGVEKKGGHSHKDNFVHTLEVVDNLSKDSNFLWLRWAALFHDIGKAVTKKYIPYVGWTFYTHEFMGAMMITRIFKRFQLTLVSVVKYVKKIVKYSARPIALVNNSATDSALRRLLLETGEDLEDILKLCKADITTKNLSKKKRYYNNFELVEQKLRKLEKKDSLRDCKLPISGEYIMKMFNLKPSPQVGVIKNSLKKAVLYGKIPNQVGAILEFFKKIAKNMKK